MTNTPNEIPHNREIEWWLIGAALKKEVACYDLVTNLTSIDFFFTENQIIFDEIKRMHHHKAPINAHTVALELKRNDRLEKIGGVQYIATVADYGGFNINVEYYIEELKKMSISRQLIDLSRDLKSEVTKNPESIDIVLDKYHRKIGEIGSFEKSKFVDLSQIPGDYLEGLDYESVLKHEVENVKNGVDIFKGFRSGFPSLDKLIGGFG